MPAPDHMTPDHTAPAGLTPAVGGEDSTRGRVLTLVHQRGRCTVAEIAGVLDLTPQAIRRHVCTLTEEGWLDMRNERPCSAGVRRGRPQQVYTLSDTGRSIFMQGFQTLYLDILRHVESEFGKGAVSRVIGAKMREAAQQLSADWPADFPLERRLDALQQYLVQCGFEAKIEECDDFFCLSKNRCPYLALAQQHPSICRIEQNVLTELLGTTVECESRASTQGTGGCRYKIIKPNAGSPITETS